MITKERLSYTFIFVIIAISLALIIFPNSNNVTAAPNRINLFDKSLIITVNEYDNEIADMIVEEGPGTAINYTHIDIERSDNISNILTGINTEEYKNFIFILSDIQTDFTDSIVTKLDDCITKGVSITLMTSKLHSLNPKMIDLFGLTLPSAGDVEYEATEEEIDFTILNDTYSQFPYPFAELESIGIKANISIVDSFDNQTTMLLQSEYIEEISADSGFFVKLRSPNEGKLLTIPLSLSEETNEDVLEIITSLSYHLISWSNEKTRLFYEDNNTNSSTDGQNSNLDFKFNINSEIITGVAISSGLIIAGVVTYKTFSNKAISSKTSTKKEEEILHSPFPSWILLLLTPIIWLFAQILYPPKLRRISKSQVIDNEMRAEILDILEFYDFDHFNSLKKQLKSGVSILRWHLQILEDFELIAVKRVKQYKVYHLDDAIIDPDRILLYCSIRSNKAFDIIESLISQKSQTTKELSLQLQISNDLIKYHCVKLSNEDILEYNAITNEYKINETRINNLKWLLERMQKQKSELNFQSN